MIPAKYELHGGSQAPAGDDRMAPAKSLTSCGADWVLRGEGMSLNDKAFGLI